MNSSVDELMRAIEIVLAGRDLRQSRNHFLAMRKLAVVATFLQA